MIAYLLDTNHFSRLWRDDPRVAEPIRGNPAGTFAVSMPSVGELWFMVFKSSRVPFNRKRLAMLLRDFDVLDFDATAAMEFGRIKSELSRRDTLIPDADIQIAAIARSRGLVLLTADAHFSHIGGLVTEDWTRP